MRFRTLAGLAIGGTAATVAGGAAAAALGYRAYRRATAYDVGGKTVLITGGSRGLEFAIAREFLRQGARVALCARNEAELERAGERLRAEDGAGGEVFTVAADLGDEMGPGHAVAAVRRHFGGIDVLVHNAGVIQLGPWEAMEEADFARAMDIHFWAALRLARAVLPEMIARGSGRIVNVASIGGMVAVPHMLPYTASKFALVGLTQGLGAEVRRHGVRVGCVCPFLTRTGSQGKVEVKGNHEAEFAWFAAAGSMPVLTQSAGRAARRIVLACRLGEAHVVLSVAGKLAAWAHGLAPGTLSAGLGQAERLLPRPEAGAASAHTGRSGQQSYSGWTRRVIEPLVRRAGAELNQGAGGPVGVHGYGTERG